MMLLQPGVVWAIALVGALIWCMRSARSNGLDPRSMYWAGVCVFLGGLWGGHILGLLVHGWSGGPFAWLQFWNGSKSYYGGLIGGAVAAVVFFRGRNLSISNYADAGTPAVALGYSIGRIGCFLNGDDYGTVTQLPWAVTFPPGTEVYDAHLTHGWISAGAASTLPVHPVQLYESLSGLLLFVILACWPDKRPGDRLWVFATLYGTTRFLLEYLRGDFVAVLGPFSLPQVCSLALLVAGIAFGMKGRFGADLRSADRVAAVP